MKPIRVLVVDDQPRARDSMKALLTTWDAAVEVREARNGREAVELAGRFRPDIVLIDVRMPELDGPRATTLMKALWPRVRVVALSLYPENRQEALAAGADAFVAKGDAWEELLGTLERIAKEERE